MRLCFFFLFQQAIKLAEKAKALAELRRKKEAEREAVRSVKEAAAIARNNVNTYLLSLIDARIQCINIVVVAQNCV